ncbi:MAG: hypothetical protein ACE5K8_04045 [Candidatus Zixiibacteriota bacterium]
MVVSRKYLGTILGMTVAVLVGGSLARLWSPAGSWFLGGLLMGLSGILFWSTPERRRPARVVLAMTLAGAAAALVAHLAY